MAYTERGIFYQTDYDEDADILEDMEHMAKSTDDAIGNLSEDVSTSLINIFGIDIYNFEETYVIGNMVIYDSKIYICIATTTGDFDDTKWEEISIKELINEKYRKPNEGIPKTDLSSEVQTSLGKADTALQEHQDITGKEDSTNKVTELTSESTNTQYPGAKAVYDELVSVKAENTKLENKVATLRKTISQNPQVTDTDYEPTLADTIEAPFEQFDVKGHSEQETTEGNQLIKYPYNETSKTVNGITFTDNKDGTITANGTATAETYFNMWTWANKYQLAAGTYTLSGGATPAGVSLIGGVTDTSGNNISGGNFGLTSSRGTHTNTINQDFMIYFYISIESGRTVNNYTFKPMFNAGSTAKEWEKFTYGASPNPSYEQPVKSAGDNGTINEKVQSRNLFPKIISSETTVNGVKFTPNDDGSITVRGTSNVNWVVIFLGAHYTLQAGTYKCSCKNGSSSIYAQFYDNTNKIYRTSNQNAFTISEEIDAYNFGITIPRSGTTVDETLYPMLEFGSTATDYVPHEEQNISIPVQAPFRSIGEVEDEFVLKNDGKWYERHWIGRKIFDGTENWTLNSSIKSFVISNINLGQITTDTLGKVLSNFFRQKSYYYSSEVGVWLDGSLIITTTGSWGGSESANDFKAYLAQQYANETPVYVDYILQTPTDILCTQVQSDILDSLTETVHTYREETYITSPDEVKARIKVSGLYDLNKLVTRVETLESEV